MSGANLPLLAERLEGLEVLDPIAAPVRSIGGRIRAGQPFGDLLSGSPFGHPAHPALVVVPLGAWSCSLLLDLSGGQGRAARRLVALGIVSAVPAALSGLSDWSDTELAEQRVGLVHAAGNTLALMCFAASWWARRRSRARGILWSMVGMSAASVAGWLGGHLAYGMGVGVDTNAFQSGPEDWTAVAAPAPGGMCRAEVGGVGIVVATTEDGAVHAMADRCSHRGGPLSEGTLEEGCVVCPWHGSAFNLVTGQVVRGPASIPQPVYETRSVGSPDKVEVRRVERRGLRARAV